MSVKVSGTTITATRGDTVKLLIGLYDHEGNKYIPQEGDSSISAATRKTTSWR